MNLDRYKYVYLIGIGGIGMSALARYFNIKGKRVFGYDRLRSDLCIALEKEGVYIHHDNNISAVPYSIKKSSTSDLLIIYTPAVSLNNELLSYFSQQGFKPLKRAEVLGIISKKSYTIAIAGTHGKTTTSTMLTHLLQKKGKSVTAFLGGISLNYNTNFFLADEGNLLVVEADEYDKSFLHINPDIAVITSVSADHLDIYDDVSDLYLAFQQFASQVKKKGLLLVEESVNLDFPIPEGGVKLQYSADIESDFFAKNISIKNRRMYFDIMGSSIRTGIDLGEKKKDIELQMPGSHNISNAIAASAVAFYLGLSYTDVQQGLASFAGIYRRFHKHIDTQELVYIDDYAHHPEEVRATINTIRQLYPLRKLIVVFQPHLFSRTKNLANEFAHSLQNVDELVLLEIFPAREDPIPGVNSKMLLDLCDNAKKTICSKEHLLSFLGGRDIDVLLTLGAGDIGSLAQPIKHMLN